MKFIKINKLTLLPLLEAAVKFAGVPFTSVDKGVYEKDKSPVVRLVFSENILEIQALNLTSGINLRLAIVNDDEATYLVPARLLTEMISKCEEEEILLGLDKDHLVIKHSLAKTSLKEIEDENPTPPAKIPTYATCMSGEEFSHALSMVAFAALKDGSIRPNLNGVFVDLSANKDLTLVATDGVRLSIYSAQLDWTQIGRESYEKAFILPLKTTTNLIACLAKETGKVKIGVNTDRFFIEWDNGYVFSNLVIGNFPDWKTVYPENSKTTIKFLNGFQNAVRAARVLASGSDRGVPRVAFDITEERTLVKSESDLGNSLIKLTPSIEGDSTLNISFNGDLLPDQILGEISVGLNAPNTPAIFESSTAPGWRYLLMPVLAQQAKAG